jgi:hypothetical protein
MDFGQCYTDVRFCCSACSGGRGSDWCCTDGLYPEIPGRPSDRSDMDFDLCYMGVVRHLID